MRSGGFQRNDMHALPHPKNISLIHRIPQTRTMSQMTLRRHQQLQRNILRSRRIRNKSMRFVVWGYRRAKSVGPLLDVLEFMMVACYGIAFACSGRRNEIAGEV